MRVQLLHLDGPYRGRTSTYAQNSSILGSTLKAEIRFHKESNVADWRAKITFVEQGCSFYRRAINGDVFVNRQQIDEVILAPEGLLEMAIGGPKMRFRVRTDDCPPCKPIRQMLRDARGIRGAGGLVAATNLVRHDLVTQDTAGLRRRDDRRWTGWAGVRLRWHRDRSQLRGYPRFWRVQFRSADSFCAGAASVTK